MPAHGHDGQVNTGDGDVNDLRCASNADTPPPDYRVRDTGGGGSHSHNAAHNLSGSISGVPDKGTLAGSISSASASINVKYQDVLIAQKD